MLHHHSISIWEPGSHGRQLLPALSTTRATRGLRPVSWTRRQERRMSGLDSTTALTPVFSAIREVGIASGQGFKPSLPEQPKVDPRGSSPPSEDGDASNITQIWKRLYETRPHDVMLEDPHRGGITVTSRQLWDQMQTLAAGLQQLGLLPGEKVSLFSENSSRWLVADQAIMLNGCADCVRGSTAPVEELTYIMSHSHSSGLVIQDMETLRKMAPTIIAGGVSRRGTAAAGETAAAAAADAPTVSPGLKFVLVLWGSVDDVRQESEALGLPVGLPVLAYDQVLDIGQGRLELQAAGEEQQGQEHQGFLPAPMSQSDVATLVYTSGTTGNPKAVMLTHGNLMYQVQHLSHFMPVKAGECMLSLLPPWHIYERSTSYYTLSRGARQVYTSIRRFKDDLPRYRPDHFVCVPLVLDTLYSRIQSQFNAMPALRKAVVTSLLAASTAYIKACRVTSGTALQYARSSVPALVVLQAALLAALLHPIHILATKLVYVKVREAVGIRQSVVSGGGSLAPHLDDFYEVLGLQVVNGWGLTETSPVLACRQLSKNVRGTIGVPTPGTEARVVDPETLADLPDGSPGLLLARGPGVMLGYMDDPASTNKAFRAGDGWFDTGDLGWRAPAGVSGSVMGGMLVLTGRAKDTLVLSSGKKVEPEPIEGALTCSPLIKHVILLGQDKRQLGALVFPDMEAVERMEASTSNSGGNATTDNSKGSSSLGSNGGTSIGTNGTNRGRLEELLTAEVARLNRSRPDFRSWENIAHIAVIESELSVEDGTLTRTMKPRRAEISKKYSVQVQQLISRLRGDRA